MNGATRHTSWLAAMAALLLPAALWPQALRVDADPASVAIDLGSRRTLTVRWLVDLGPTRLLDVASSGAGIGFDDGSRQPGGGALPTQLQRTGLVTFLETVVIDPATTTRAFDRGGGMTYERRFRVRAATGGPRLDTAGRLRIELAPRAVVLSGPLPAPAVAACDTVLDLAWEVVSVAGFASASIQALSATIRAGTAIETIDRRARPPWRLHANRRRLPDRLTIPPAIWAALPPNGRIAVDQTFEVRDDRGVFLLAAAASTTLANVGPPLLIEVQPAALPAAVALGDGARLRLRWTAAAARCQTLESSQGWYQLPGEAQPIAALPGTIGPLRDGQSADESLLVPPLVAQRARALGATRLEIMRTFSERLFARPGPRRRQVGAVVDLLPAAAAPFEITALTVSFNSAPFRTVGQGAAAFTAGAEIRYRGRGLLQAHWQLADPLAPAGGRGAACSPPELGFTRLATVLENLSFGDPVFLTSPPLPTHLVGLHRLRLCIAAPQPSFVGPGETYPEARYYVEGGEDGAEPPPGGGPGNDWHPPPGPAPDGGLAPPPPDQPPVDDQDPMVEREVLVLVAAGRARGLERLALDLKHRYRLQAFSQPFEINVLRVPAGNSVSSVVAKLRGLGLAADANHRYRGQQDPSPSTHALDRVGAEDIEQARRRWSRDADRPCPPLSTRIGLIDTSVSTGGSLATAPIETRSLTIGRPADDRHGTLLARLLVGDHGLFAGGSKLFAAAAFEQADTVGGRRRAPGHLDTLRIMLALNWLADKVDVIAMPFTGPPSLLLRFYLFRDPALDNVSLVAAYGGPDSRHHFPAVLDRVHGAVAVGLDGSAIERLGARDLQTPAFAAPGLLVDGTVVCGNSCAVPYLAASVALTITRVGNRQAAVRVAMSQSPVSPREPTLRRAVSCRIPG